ncbi:DUF3168 domain-containing protein [Salaquimonas pukyongi]|uniref:DUF3168 domain-containing protein n=1 Tax=Salaquimonas pukyongi TaxID=2712698 RepID=UPI00096BCCE8|nr:DUF3168 domain-containing protein [Salaquimonas pukyongi]
MTAALELQMAIVSALRQSTALTALLGGAHIYDDVPDARRPPYVVIGPVETLDWSTSTEAGEEHFIDVAIWSLANGRKAVVSMAAEIRTTLSSLPRTLAGHVLVNLTHESTRSQAGSNDRHFRAVVTFRAVTEPLT